MQLIMWLLYQESENIGFYIKGKNWQIYDGREMTDLIDNITKTML